MFFTSFYSKHRAARPTRIHRMTINQRTIDLILSNRAQSNHLSNAIENLYLNLDITQSEFPKMSEAKLRYIDPVPLDLDQPVPGVPTPSSSSKPFTLRAIQGFTAIQKYSAIPFSFFTVLHLSAVVAAPLIAGVDVGNEMISMGRELYQTSFGEQALFASIFAHIGSGIALRILRAYQRYVKYGSSKIQPKREKKISVDSPEDEVIDDKNQGLGGILSLFGFGSRQSLSFKWLGLSPLSFSGYLLILILFLHVRAERLAPLQVDGDSSLVDLSYVAHAISRMGSRAVIGMTVITGLTSYHMLSGWNRYLGLFTKKHRRRTYTVIVGITLAAFASVIKIGKLGPAFGFTAEAFDKYIEASH